MGASLIEWSSHLFFDELATKIITQMTELVICVVIFAHILEGSPLARKYWFPDEPCTAGYGEIA